MPVIARGTGVGVLIAVNVGRGVDLWVAVGRGVGVLVGSGICVAVGTDVAVGLGVGGGEVETAACASVMLASPIEPSVAVRPLYTLVPYPFWRRVAMALATDDPVPCM